MEQVGGSGTASTVVVSEEEVGGIDRTEVQTGVGEGGTEHAWTHALDMDPPELDRLEHDWAKDNGTNMLTLITVPEDVSVQ